VLDDLHASFSRQGIRFLIAGIHAQPLVALDRAGRLDLYGRDNFVADIHEALRKAREILAIPT
jgi:SulP family sulfate permease